MEIKMAAKKRITRGVLILTLFVIGIVACSNLASKTPTPITPTKLPETTSYQFVLEKSLGKGIVEAADWAPDGSSFALATSVQVDLYDAQTFEIIATLDTGQWSKVVAYSPDSKLLATGEENGAVQIWDVASRKLLHKLIPSGKQILYRDVVLTFSSNSQQLVSSLYQTIYLWDLNTGKLIDSFPGYLDEIDSVAISPGGKFVVATGYRKLFVRDTSTKQLLYPPLDLEDDIEAVLFEQDSSRFKTVSSGKIQIWDLFSGEVLDERLTHKEVSIVDVTPTHDQIVLAKEGEISVWDTSVNKVIFTIQSKTSWLDSIAISPDGQKLITVDERWGDGTVQVWDLTSKGVIKAFDQYDLPASSAVFSPDGKVVAVSNGTSVTQIREVRSGRLLRSIDWAGHLTFSPDSKTIAYTTGQTYIGSEYSTVVLADTETGEGLPISSYTCPGVEGIAFTPDGNTIAFGGYNDCGLQLRNLQTGELLLNLSKVEGNEYLPSHEPVFSPDGKRMALGGSRPKILDTGTGKTLRDLEAVRTAEVAFSPDGRYLAVSGMGRYTEKDRIQIWNAASDQIAFTIDTLQDEIYEMMFSADGRFLLVKGTTAEAWDLWRGKPLAELKSPGNPPVGMMFSADGRTLMTVGANGTLQTWTLQPDPQWALRSDPTPTALSTLTATPVVPTVELAQVAELGKGYSSTVHRSPDGKLAGFIEGNVLKWFDTRSLKQLGSIEIGDSFGEIIFSPDNKFAIVPFMGAAIIDLEKQERVGQVYGGNGFTHGYQFSSDGRYMAYTIGDRTTGGPYHRIGLWDLLEGKEAFPEWEYFHTLLEDRYHTMSAPAISPNGNFVAAGHSDKRVYIWDLHTGESYLTLEGHAEEVTAVDYSPNGKVLASGSLDGTIRLWDPSTGKLIRVLTGFTDNLYDIRFNRDGRSLRVFYAEGEEESVSLDTGKIVPVPTVDATPDPLEMEQYRQGFSSSSGNRFSQVLFSPDGNTMALTGQNVLLWDVATQELLTFLNNPGGGVARGIAFNSDGTLLAITTSTDEILVWDVNSGEEIFRRQSDFLFGGTVFYAAADPELTLARGAGTLSEQGLAFSPARDLLAFGNDNAIEIWDVRTSEKTAEFVNPKGSYATQFSFTEDGKHLYVILNRNREAQVWDIGSGKLIKQVKLTNVNPNAFTAVALKAPLFARNNSSEDSSWIELWNLDEETLIRIDTPTGEIEPLRFSPDGSLLTAAVRENGTYFWKTATGEVIYQTEIGSYGLSISAENRWLAIGMDGRAGIYDLRPILALPGQREVSVPQATATPQVFAWPTATPIPLQLHAGEDSSSVINSQNASRVVEKARFGNGTIDQFAWSPAGDSIISTGSLGVSQYSFQSSTKTWSSSYLAERKGWTYHTVSLSDGRTLAVSADVGRVQVWDITTGKGLVDLEGGGEPAISPDGSLLVYMDSDGVLQTWDIANAEPVASLKSHYAYSLWPIFSTDGKWVAAVQSLKRYADWIRVWDARTGEIVNALGGPDNDITDLSFSTDGQSLVGAAGGSAWIWSLHPGTEPEEIQLYEGRVDGNLNVYPNTVTAAALSPDGQIIAIGTSEHAVWIYDRKTQQPLFQLKGHSSGIRRLSFSPDGGQLASVDEDGVLMIWHMTSQKRVALLDDHKGFINGLVYRADGDVAAWGAGIAWHIHPADATLQHTTSIDSGRILAVSPTGDFLAVYNPFQVALVDAKNGTFLQTLEGEAQEPYLDYREEGAAFRQFYDAAFSQDGKYLVTAGAGGVWYYDTVSKDLLQQLPGSNAQKVAMSPDGNWILTSLYEPAYPISVFDLQSGSQVFSLDEYGEGKRYLQSAFSPDGRWVGTVRKGWDGPSELVIYDTISHHVYKSTPLEEDMQLSTLAFNPSGNVIAAGKTDGEILLIDFSTLKVLATLTGHHDVAEHLIFSLDGQYLISASTDGTIRTWGLP